MPNNYFQLLNHAYSFSTSTVNSGGVTFSLPQNDYGVYGQKVDALFGSLSNATGGTQSLSAWFVSDAGLTYYSHDLGASAAVTAYIQSKFPINAGSQGYGLIDLRGSADWNQIIGDGIVGPTRGSTASIANTNCQQYINGVVTLFGLLKTAYPSIDWAIAGLPHIPFHATYAPVVGQSFSWAPSLTNSGGYTAPYWWDPQHPTGQSGDLERFYDWSNMPAALGGFYSQVLSDGPQRQVLDDCEIGWLCPDIRVPYTDILPFYGYGYNPIANYNRNLALVLNASSYGHDRLIKTYPLISNMYPSRNMNIFDDRDGGYTTTSSDGEYIDIDGSSYTGASANSSEAFYPLITFRLDMINAGVQGNANGFVYRDVAPTMIDAACTASVTASNSLYDLQIRSRNMFSTMFYGGAYADGYEPVGGYTASSTISELRRFCSNESLGYLNEIRESINISPERANENQNNPAKNGWIRAAENPELALSFENQESTNTTDSDIIYGEQKWGLLGGDNNNCNCPDPCEGVICEPVECCECYQGECQCNPNCEENDPCEGVVCSEICTRCENGICVPIPDCDPDPDGECTCCGDPWNGGPCLCPDWDPEACGQGFRLAESSIFISNDPIIEFEEAAIQTNTNQTSQTIIDLPPEILSNPNCSLFSSSDCRCCVQDPSWQPGPESIPFLPAPPQDPEWNINTIPCGWYRAVYYCSCTLSLTITTSCPGQDPITKNYYIPLQSDERKIYPDPSWERPNDWWHDENIPDGGLTVKNKGNSFDKGCVVTNTETGCTYEVLQKLSCESTWQITFTPSCDWRNLPRRLVPTITNEVGISPFFPASQNGTVVINPLPSVSVTNTKNPFFGSVKYLDRVPGSDQTNTTDRPFVTLEEQNYLRARKTDSFLINRKLSDPFAKWLDYYKEKLESFESFTSLQAQSTILKPSVSANALKLHDQKDNTVYYPGHYFSP